SVSPSSRAMSRATAFSNPSPLMFENGRLFGSAQTRSACSAAGRSCSRLRVDAAGAVAATNHQPITSSWLEREDIQLSSLVRVSIDVRVYARGAAHAREYCDVLLAVGTEVGDRRADDARACLEAPELLTRACVERLEVAVDGAVEEYVAGRDERAAVHEELLGDRPDRFPSCRIPCDERAAISP